MAYLIHHIDEIARTKKRHVASIMFDLDFEGNIQRQLADIEEQREIITAWLSAHKIEYEPCYGFFDGSIETLYKGDLYVDLEVDLSNPAFCSLRDLLENADETYPPDWHRLAFRRGWYPHFKRHRSWHRRRLQQAQAAICCAAVVSRGFQFHGSSSCSLLFIWSLMRSRTSAR